MEIPHFTKQKGKDMLFSTEQVSKWHPDKACDQVSDAILTAYMREDKNSHCGIETMWKGENVFLAGEVTSKAKVDRGSIVHRVADKLGYKVTRIVDAISEQSPEIREAVDGNERIGAGDQGMMFGFACKETESMLPLGFEIANKIIAALEKNTDGSFLVGDAKTQVTVDDAAPRDLNSVKKILISACTVDDIDLPTIRLWIENIVRESIELPKNVEFIINPSGLWTIGGPTADAGLTGRKIVCDQYGGYCPVGGGAFSGKDPTKVDRSASYMARELACQLVELYEFDYCEVQLAYAIGIAEPVSVNVLNDRGMDLSKDVAHAYDLTPKGIIRYLDLYNRDYEKIAEGCHYRTRM